jgi:hypothetical protein
LLVILAVVAASIWLGTKIQNNDTAVAKIYPVEAVDFLEKSGLSNKRGYNSYMWGGYLIWQDVPVFIDGRADVYGDNFIFSYLDAINLTKRWREPLEEFNVDYVLIDNSNRLSIMLAEAADWQEAYRDEIAVVFVPIED